MKSAIPFLIKTVPASLTQVTSELETGPATSPAELEFEL